MMQLLLPLHPKVPHKNAFTRAFSQIINPDSASVRSDTSGGKKLAAITKRQKTASSPATERMTAKTGRQRKKDAS
jgi:hypothetical protein